MKLSWEQKNQAIYAALKSILGNEYPSEGAGWSQVATFEDAAIVRKGAELFSYPVAFKEDGKVTLGEPAPVEAVYQAIAQAAAQADAVASEAIGSRILAPFVEEGEGAKPGSRWLVCVIEEGLSQNRALYPAAVLMEACQLYDKAKVFWNHVEGDGHRTPLRDPRDIAGLIRSPRFAAIASEGAGKAARHAILATLHATTKEARERLLEAHESGNPNLYGLSHTAACAYENVRLADGPARRIKQIKAVESVDVVSFPSAGGRVLRLVAGLKSPVEVTEEDLLMLDKKIATLREAHAHLVAKLSATPTETEVDALLLEALTCTDCGASADTKKKEAESEAAAAEEKKAEEARRAAAAPGTTRVVEGLKPEDRALLIEAKVDRQMKGRKLPDAMVEPTRSTMIALYEAGAPEGEVKKFLEGQVGATAKLVEAAPGGGTGMGTQAGTSVSKDEADKLLRALDGFFGAGASPQAVDGVQPFRSFKEAYIAITGDKALTGTLHESVGLSRFARMTEALTTASWAEILGDSITRAMLADYRTLGPLDDWRKIVSSIVPVADFRTQRRMRVAGYGDLPVVAQSGNYDPLTSPGDEEATYSVSKRGGMESITLEMIANDDVGAIRRIPTNLSRAAKRTMYKSVFNLLRDNSLIYDGVALAAAGHGNNIIATALSTANIAVARRLMAEQTAFGVSDDPLNLSPRTLVVPAELEELAWRATSIPMQPMDTSRNATEPSFPRSVGLNQFIVVPYWTDADNYWLVADPADVPTIEVGFFQGRQEPEVFVADQPNVGSNFTADKTEYKIRFIWGVAVMDFRGFVGGIVP